MPLADPVHFLRRLVLSRGRRLAVSPSATTRQHRGDGSTTTTPWHKRQRHRSTKPHLSLKASTKSQSAIESPIHHVRRLFTDYCDQSWREQADFNHRLVATARHAMLSNFVLLKLREGKSATLYADISTDPEKQSAVLVLVDCYLDTR